MRRVMLMAGLVVCLLHTTGCQFYAEYQAKRIQRHMDSDAKVAHLYGLFQETQAQQLTQATPEP